MRTGFVVGSVIAVVLLLIAAVFWPAILWLLFFVVVPLIALGIRDMTQTRHAVLRNFPLIGHFRYLFEAVRPEINQYFVESDLDGRPFNRIERSVVYQRSKRELDTLPFGTRYDLYEPGREWINHSIVPAQSTPRATTCCRGRGALRTALFSVHFQHCGDELWIS